MKIYDYSPGNGTRYTVVAVQVNDPPQADQLNISPGGWFIGMPNIRDAKCYAFQPSGFLDVGYVESHIFRDDDGKDRADAEAVTQLLGQIMQRSIRNPWKKCKSCGLPIHPDQNKVGLCAGCEYRQNRR